MKSVAASAALAASLLGASTAWAHPQHAGDGMLSGFLHPLLGLDHVAAMIAVGAWAAQLGARALWAVPSAFVAAMAAGALLGCSGLAVPLLEPMIAATVLALGWVVMLRARVAVAGSAALVAAFALLHGAAHAAEMSASPSLLGYGLGFLLATGLLNLGGIGIVTATKGREAALRLAAAPVALAGGWMLVGRLV